MNWLLIRKCLITFPQPFIFPVFTRKPALGGLYWQIWASKWCKYNCDSCCLYHCGILWWFRMWTFPCSVFSDHWLSNQVQHCKGLTNHPAVNGAVYKPIVIFFMMNRGSLVLYVPLSHLQFFFHNSLRCWLTWINIPKQTFHCFLTNRSNNICANRLPVRLIQASWTKFNSTSTKGLFVFRTKTTKWTSC